MTKRTEVYYLRQGFNARLAHSTLLSIEICLWSIPDTPKECVGAMTELKQHVKTGIAEVERLTPKRLRLKASKLLRLIDSKVVDGSIIEEIREGHGDDVGVAWAKDIATSIRDKYGEQIDDLSVDLQVQAAENRRAANRQREIGQSAKEIARAKSGDSDAATYSKSDLKSLTKLSDTTITRYTKEAGVSVPPPGSKTHRYTSEETRKILIAVRNGTQDASVKQRCETALATLSNPAQITL